MNNHFFRAILVHRSEASVRGARLQSEYFPRIFLILTGALWFGTLSVRAVTSDWFVATNGTGQGTNGWADMGTYETLYNGTFFTIP